MVDRPRRTLKTGDRAAHVLATATCWSGAFRWVNGVKTGHTQRRGLRARRLGRRSAASSSSRVVLGTPSEAARDADTLALLRYGLPPLPAAPPVRRGQRPRARRRSATAGGAELELVAARTVRRVVRARQARFAAARAGRSARRSRGRSAAASARARSRSATAASCVTTRRRSSPPPPSPAASIARKTTESCSRVRWAHRALAALAATVLLAALRRRRARRASGVRRAQEARAA